MGLERSTPFRELEEVQTRLNRLFGESALRRLGEDDGVFANWSPAVDIEESDKEYLFKADLPELKKEDVKVELLDGSLTIQGERKQEKEEKGKRAHKIERQYGKFVRRFQLPNEIDATKVSADFKDGALSVHVPKSASAKSKAIDVKVS